MTEDGFKKCERCGEQKRIGVFYGRGGTFEMPWCRECRSIDPVGAKAINDRLRQARLTKKQRAVKRERRNAQGRATRLEIKRARANACDLLVNAIAGIDLSGYSTKQQIALRAEFAIVSEMISDYFRSKEPAR